MLVRRPEVRSELALAEPSVRASGRPSLAFSNERPYVMMSE